MTTPQDAIRARRKLTNKIIAAHDAKRLAPFFDPQVDPVTEKAVRHGDQWLFVSFAGVIHPVGVGGPEPVFGEPWPLFSDADRDAPHVRLADAAVCIAASPSSFVRCPCPPISSANACARPPSDSAMLFKRLAV